jgi:hypothetical protein
MQKAAIENLQILNQEYIAKLADLKSDLLSEYQEFNDLSSEFQELMKKMELASGQLPFAPYHNAYAVDGDDFCRPTYPLISDNLYGTTSSEYVFLTNEWMEELSLEFEKDFGKLKAVLQISIDKLNTVLTDVIASNSITRRLEGLQDKCSELESIASIMWYPDALSKREYAMKGQYVPPIKLGLSQVQMRYPFHRELLIRFDYLLKTRELHPNAIEKCIGILKYINNYLPFAELISEKDANKAVFNNINMPSQNQVGSGNTFDGTIAIGNKGDVDSWE